MPKPQPRFLQMCRNWQLTQRQKWRLKSRQVRFGEGAERVASRMVMGGLGVLGWVEVELVVNGEAWAGARRKVWLEWDNWWCGGRRSDRRCRKEAFPFLRCCYRVDRLFIPRAMMGWKQPCSRRQFSYIIHADALNFLLNLHIWSW